MRFVGIDIGGERHAVAVVNEEGTVKLLDFGTASLMAEQHDVTVTRARMLTPRYASPEQLRGERVNIATDVLALMATPRRRVAR